MIGMPASTSFAFTDDKLNQTVVFFPAGDIGLLVSLLRGIHGAPIDEQAMPKVWRDARRGTELTALPAAQGVMLLYRPIVTRSVPDRTPRERRQAYWRALWDGLQICWPVFSGLLLLQALLGAIVGLVESWGLGPGIYFAFITGLTVGYGDFAPSNA